MSKKTRTTSSSTQTRTPNNPTWVTEGLAGVGGALQGLMGRDPTTFVAGPSTLQTKAFDAAGGLTSSPYFGQAGDIFGRVAGAGANTYDAQGYDATEATSKGYDSVDWTGQGYDATNANASTYNASSLLEGLDKYMSPYTGQVVDAALADYDYGAGQTRANQALDEARSGAFGGSGAAITRALTESDLARGRAATSAQLRDQGFMRGAGLSATDAGFRNDAARYNADAQTRVSMANAAAANAAAAFGANARNTSAASNAAARNDALRFGADAGNQAALANAAAANAAAAFGANARNTSAASNAAARNQAAAFGANAANQAALANAAARNQAAAFRAQAQNDAGRYNAGAQDTALARQLAAGSSLADLGSTMGADQRQNIALQGALGADQQAIDQAKAQAPLSVLQQIAATYGGMPLNLLSGETVTGNSTSTLKTSDPMGAIGTLGSLALAPFTGGLSALAGMAGIPGAIGATMALGGPAAMASRALPLAGGLGIMSDRRLKTDIEKIGEREDGLGVYVYRYLWSPVRFIGVMAQEVLKVKPEAVIHTPSGYMAVNYGAL